eukprot:c55238_g1_i1 orf=71-370(-)
MYVFVGSYLISTSLHLQGNTQLLVRALLILCWAFPAFTHLRIYSQVLAYPLSFRIKQHNGLHFLLSAESLKLLLGFLNSINVLSPSVTVCQRIFPFVLF